MCVKWGYISELDYLLYWIIWSPELTGNLLNKNFHSLEVVFRWHDPQLQCGRIIQILVNVGHIYWNRVDVFFTCSKAGI